jgi:hypothetical protein
MADELPDLNTLLVGTIPNAGRFERRLDFTERERDFMDILCEH